MQNGSVRAVLQNLRKFSVSTVASGLTRYSYNSCREGAFVIEERLHPILHIPLHQQLRKRASLGLHIASFNNGTGTSMIDHAEQGCALNSLDEVNVKEMGRSEPSGQSCVSSSSPIPLEVHDRLNHLDNMVEQHSRALTLLTSQLEVQKQSLDSILDEIKRLNVDPGCKVQSFSPPFDNETTLDIVGVSACSNTDQPEHTWHEWTHFIEHLRSLPFVKELIQVPEVAGVSSNYDSTSMKRMLFKFSQAYSYIFDALSVEHLQILADYGCPNDDRRTVASHKRLKDYFDKEKKSDSYEAASSELASLKPKLLDVMRLIYMIAELAKLDGVPEIVKLSITNLLGEVIQLTTIHKHNQVARLQSFPNAGTVLQNSIREKSSSVQANLQVQGSSFSINSESLLADSPSFQQHEKSDLNFDAGMPKSRPPVTNRIDMKVPVQVEDKEPSALVSNRHMEMLISSNNGQPETTDALTESKRLIDTREQVLQECILSEKEKTVLSGDGVRDDTVADDHPDIFDDIFNQGNTRSWGAGLECSLSELIRQNKKVFSSTRREREHGVASDTDDLGRKGMRTSANNGQRFDDENVAKQRDSFHTDDLGRKKIGTFAGKGHKYDDDNDIKQLDMFLTDDSDVELEVKHMPQSKDSGRHASSNPSLDINHNSSSKIAGSFGKSRVDDDRWQCRQWSSRQGDSYQDSGAENFDSSRTHGNERLTYNKSKDRGRRDGYSESDSRGGFDRRRRQGSSRVW